MKIQVTVELDVELCDDKGNTLDAFEHPPTKQQVTDFVLSAIGHYDAGGYEADELAPESCSNLLVRNWDAIG